MTARNKNRWIVNLRLAARELEIAATRLSRRVNRDRSNCKENMKRGNMSDAKACAEKSVEGISLMECYKQSSHRLKMLIRYIQTRSCQDSQIQAQIEGIVRLIAGVMRNRHLRSIKSILDKHGRFFLGPTDESESTHESGDVTSLLEKIAKEENIEFEKVFVKKVKSCLSQRPSKVATKLAEVHRR
ncbi:charged multivesicular body protein 1b [Nilaparvata lugens]|uniref:charged multivesicular body protein 1b n=1 Tax=Nilaparvata lugens TaxID=108931 RepID=UPI00193CEE43|nr:charged multivesicular body protein 1b [Nilaparvata lugens]